ncbi:phage tail tip lysozyme [Burkholderia sp. Ac-20384]|uniref:phage tail tip lysozyme n=1 Tax=Burkholderia sp. Ac-20384 TaxID=2703902 RepID=UPI001F11E08C|nr:phage tail tip lysozyme [Burkholderia sp. Ac-20384]
MTGVVGYGSTDNNSQLEQFLEILIDELKQILSQLNANSNDNSSGPGGVASASPGGSSSSAYPSSAQPAYTTSAPAGYSPSSLPPSYSASAPSGGGSTAGAGPSTSSGAASAGPSVSSSDPATAIAQNLKDNFGLTPSQIAGVLGNLQQESGLQGNINQGGETGSPSNNSADDNAHGWGLAQWGDTRKDGEIAYANQHGLDPGSLSANLGFMDHELRTTYSQTVTDLKATSSPNEAALVWDKDYEQATAPNMDQRYKYAQDFASKGF